MTQLKSGSLRALIVLGFLSSVCMASSGATESKVDRRAADDAAPVTTADDKPPMLLLMGKRFPLDLLGGELTIHGTPLFIREVPNTGEGTGHTVWDGAVALAKCLEASYSSMVVGKHVVEVGSGTGVVGLACSLLGAASVTLTDLSYTHSNLRAAIELNKDSLKGDIEIEELDWTAPVLPRESIDLIVGSDVVWVEDKIEPLVETLVILTNAKTTDGKGHPAVILAHQTRSAAGDDLLWSLASKYFAVEEVPADQHHAAFRDDAINIYMLRRLP